MSDLATTPPSYIRCRTFGHAWDDVNPTDDEAEDFDLLYSGTNHSLLVANCTRCGNHRSDVVNSTGSLVNRRYTYPEGYLMAKGDRRPKRAEFRLQLLANRIASMSAKRGKK